MQNITNQQVATCLTNSQKPDYGHEFRNMFVNPFRSERAQHGDMTASCSLCDVGQLTDLSAPCSSGQLLRPCSPPSRSYLGQLITYLCATFFTCISSRVRLGLSGSSSRVWGLETTPRSVTCCSERGGHIVRNTLVSYQQYTGTWIIVTVLNYYVM